MSRCNYSSSNAVLFFRNKGKKIILFAILLVAAFEFFSAPNRSVFEEPASTKSAALTSPLLPGDQNSKAVAPPQERDIKKASAYLKQAPQKLPPPPVQLPPPTPPPSQPSIKSLGNTAIGHGYHPCNSSSPKLASIRAKVKETYKPHLLTQRGMSGMVEIMPPFMDLLAILKTGCSTKHFQLLEQGCGSAQFLLYAKALCPSMQLHGINFEGYKGFGQADGFPMMLAVAEMFKTPIMCSNRTGAPAFPDVRFTSSIADSDFTYNQNFPGLQFDVILSRDALNAMKLKPRESHVYIPKMLAALKPGGTIIAQTDYGADFIFHDLPGFEEKPFTIVGVVNVPHGKGTVSIMLYKKHELDEGSDNKDWDRMRRRRFYASFFGLVIRKCLSGEPITSETGCILPTDYTNPYPEDLDLWKANFSTWRPYTDINYKASMTFDGKEYFKTSPRRVDYTFAYHQNLLAVLQRWQLEGIPDQVSNAD